MAILFDLDGTLVDTVHDMVWAMNALCTELNKPLPDPKILKNHVSFGIENILEIALKINTRELPVAQLNSLKARFKALYKESKFKTSNLFPGLDSLIDAVKQKGFKTGVVTNKTLEFATPILERVKLAKKIDCLVTSDMVLNPKPAPEPVLLAIKTLKVEPTKCLFIGDAEQDILAGNAAGVKTVAALFGYIGDLKCALKWPANYFIKESTDLLPLVSSLYSL